MEKVVILKFDENYPESPESAKINRRYWIIHWIWRCDRKQPKVNALEEGKKPSRQKLKVRHHNPKNQKKLNQKRCAWNGILKIMYLVKNKHK